MAYDPRFQNQLELEAIAKSARERLGKRGLARLPLTLILLLLPFLLIARALVWTWRTGLRRG